MAVEIEAKMKVPDHHALRCKLAELGATPRGRFLEVNTFFDTEDRALLAGDKGLRLRQNRDIDSQAEQFVITFKGPRLNGKVKSREELEVVVGNGDDAVELLEKLGFHRMLSFQKRRDSFRLDDCSVELDELPHLGCYVEIEGPDEAAVLRVREKLGLAGVHLVRASYIALLMAWLQEQGRHGKDIVFETESAAVEQPG
jgi:adenylate cyclase class 2